MPEDVLVKLAELEPSIKLLRFHLTRNTPFPLKEQSRVVGITGGQGGLRAELAQALTGQLTIDDDVNVSVRQEPRVIRAKRLRWIIP